MTIEKINVDRHHFYERKYKMKKLNKVKNTNIKCLYCKGKNIINVLVRPRVLQYCENCNTWQFEFDPFHMDEIYAVANDTDKSCTLQKIVEDYMCAYGLLNDEDLEEGFTQK